MTSLKAKPVVIWASDPVRAGETVVVRGDGFGIKAVLEISLSQNGNLTDWQPVEVLQQTPSTLKFALPAQIGDGIVRFRINEGKESSAPSILNAPKIWWMQGDETETATPGGWLRLFGLNLNLRPGAKATLRAGDSTIVLTPEAIDEFAVSIPLPTDLKPGEYRVDFHNGLADAAANTTAGKIQIASKKAAPVQVFDVTKYGAVPAELAAEAWLVGRKATRSAGGDGEERSEGGGRAGGWSPSAMVALRARGTTQGSPRLITA